MKRYLLIISIVLFLLHPGAWAQSNQTVTNGAATTAVNFPGTGCVYNWVNNTPGIGLAASGTGDISSFTAMNNGSAAVVATITATPISAGFAYVTVYGSNSVSVVNIATNMVVATVAVGSGPTGVSVSPDGSRAYIANSNSNTIFVINTATNMVSATIPVGLYPFGVAVSPDGDYVYVANESSNTVSVISTTTNTVSATIPAGIGPNGISVSPDGSKIFVADEGSNGLGTVSVINTANNTITATIPVGLAAIGITVSPNGKWVYAVNQSSNTISVISTATNSVVSTIPVGTTPYGVAASPNGSFVYVANNSSGTISVINAATNAVIATIPVGDAPVGVSVSPDGSFLIAENSESNTVSVINTATNTVIKTVTIGTAGLGPFSIGNFITGGTGCSGSPITFTITVNPTPATPPTITTGTASGTISACAGTASVSPQIQQFTVSGNNLTGNITATAPPGFEVSLSAGSGYAGSITVTQTAGTISNTVVYVRSSATAGPGSISGSVKLTSTGATTQSVKVTGIVNALPTVNTITNQTVGTGTATAAVNFTGTAAGFNWVNDTPAIGLAAAGVGNIPSFIASNTGSSPITATITVTPVPLGYAYIANRISNTLSVINIATNQVIATIPLGTSPWGVSVSADGSRVYVTNQGSNTLSVINTASNSVSATITVGSIPDGVVLSPDGSLVYVANNGSSSVSVINTATNTVKATIAVGTNPAGITISPDGSRVYVTNESSDNVYVINTATNAVAAIIPLTTSCVGVAISPDGSSLYVADQSNAFVTVISTATNTITAQIAVMQAPNGLSVSPDGALVYVSNSGSNSVSVINTTTNMVVATIPFSAEPFAVSFTPDGTRVFVTDIGSNYVSVINTATNTIVSTIQVGSNPNSLGNFITETSPCAGTPVTFTITVKPSELPAITAGAVTGSIRSCTGTPSVSPQIQQFTVSGSNLTGNITATAPTGFEVSLSAAGVYGNSITLTPTAGTVSNTVVYVRSAASAATGGISGNVTLSAAGATNQTIGVTGTVNALATVNAVANQTFMNGDPTTAINFTGTGNTFNWVNNTPGIGLAASGSGSIPSFTAVNTGSISVTATITVTPESSGFAYITNQSDGTISVINTTNNNVVSTFQVGNEPYSECLSPNGAWLYVAHGAGLIAVVNTATNTVTTNITVGMAPFGLVVSPDGTRLYVANTGSNTISVISTSSNSIIATIAAGGMSPNGIALSPDGTLLYVANGNSNAVAIINTATDALVTTIPVGTNPQGIAVGPNGATAYVANYSSNSVSVINTATNTVSATVATGFDPIGLSVSPDGNAVYVANHGSSSVSVINTATNIVTATIGVSAYPEGTSISPDGSKLYVSHNVSNTVTVINPATNAVIANVQVGNSPNTFGNFVSGGGCSGDATTFTITVSPIIPPTITVGNTTGSIFACLGTASVSPNIQQFTFSGSDIAGDINATANVGFEISTSINSGYASSLTFAESGGNVPATTIYVRAAATGTAGPITGSIVLTSSGAMTKNAAVSGDVFEEASVNPVSPQTFTSGTQTAAIDFTGTATNYNWVNDTPSIGLSASGSGNIGPFTAINTGSAPVTATITVTPITSGGATGGNITCTGTPLTFTITVNLPPPPVITAAGELPPLVTTYGTPSASTIFTVSANDLTAGILVTPPLGFEVSTDDVTFTSTITIGKSGTLATTQVYMRLAATTPVGDDAYGGSIALTSPTAPTVDITMPLSTVNPALLAVIADNKSKAYGAVNPVLTASYIGFVNNETAAVFTTPPVLSTTAVTTSPVGQYPITVSGGEAANYSITSYIPGILTIAPAEQDIFIPNTFTPNGDGINDTWNIKYLDFYSNCSVNIFNRWGQNVFTSIGYGIAWDGTYRGAPLPVGTYYYIINLKNGGKILSGYVAIIR